MLKLKTPIFWPPDLKSRLIGKDPDAGKDWRQRRSGWQRMRLLDSITDSMGMNLGKLREMLRDREAWGAVVHEVSRSQTWLSDWTTIKACSMWYRDNSLEWRGIKLGNQTGSKCPDRGEATVKTEKINLDYMLEMGFTGFGDRLQSKQRRETPRASPKLLAWADIRDHYLNWEKRRSGVRKQDEQVVMFIIVSRWSWRLKIWGENLKTGPKDLMYNIAPTVKNMVFSVGSCSKTFAKQVGLVFCS